MPVLLGLAGDYTSIDQAPTYFATKVTVLTDRHLAHTLHIEVAMRPQSPSSSIMLRLIRQMKVSSQIKLRKTQAPIHPPSNESGWRPCMAPWGIATT